jgi:hypothetical protein
MSLTEATVEVSCRVDRDMTHVFMFKVPTLIWNRFDEQHREECMRRKLWVRLACEYKVAEQE